MNKSYLRLPRYVVIICLFVGLGIIARPLTAHTEGKLQLSAVPAGPYQLSVWTSPDPAIVDELHVALSIVLAEDASPVLDADVTIRLTNQDDGSTYTAAATTEESENKFLYEAILEPETQGVYEVTILVIGADDLQGGVSFSLEIVNDSGFNLLWLIPIGLVIIAAGIYAYNSRKDRRVGKYSGNKKR